MVFFSGVGTFNRLHTVSLSDCGDGLGSLQYTLRVTPPVELFYKTASEVATLSYIREHTPVPVPCVIISNSTVEDVGFDWILMERVPSSRGFLPRQGPVTLQYQGLSPV